MPRFSALVRIVASAAWVAIASAMFVADARAALVLNEVLYDPSGADRGSEWIEIANDGTWPVALDGLALERHADGGEWQPLWEGTSGEIAAGRFLAIGGPFRGRQADVSASFTLRNEGESIRLRKANVVLDALAWGDGLESEGHSAPKVAAGLALARRIDSFDSDRNLEDFEAAVPTPGRANHPARDLALALRRPGRALPLGPATRAVAVAIHLENRGRETLDSDEIRLSLRDSLRALESPRLPPLAPGGHVELSCLLDLDAGWIVASILDSLDAVPENNADTLRVHRVDPPLRLTEVLARPDTVGAEWIELRAWRDVDLAGWSVEDAGGTRAALAPRLVRPEELLVLRADARGRDWTGQWPSLNDRAAADGAADSLFLFDPRGELVDWAVWGDGARGLSWSREPSAPIEAGLAAWRVGDPTPGRTTAADEVESSDGLAPEALSLEHRPDGTWLRLAPELFPGRFAVRVVALDGRVVFREEGEETNQAERWLRWNGRDSGGARCASGVYLVALEAERESGGIERARATLVLSR